MKFTLSQDFIFIFGLELMEKHGWSKYFNVDILDSDAEEILENPNGLVIKKTFLFGTYYCK